MNKIDNGELRDSDVCGDTQLPAEHESEEGLQKRYENIQSHLIDMSQYDRARLIGRIKYFWGL